MQVGGSGSLEAARLLSAVADLGRQSLGKRGFRAAALELLNAHLGFDGALFHTLAGDTTLDQCVCTGVEERLLLQCHVGYGERYARDVEAMQRAAQGGVCRDLDLVASRDRHRVPLYEEISRPMGYGNSVYLKLGTGTQEMASVFLMRPHGARYAFSPDHAAVLRLLVPVLTLAEMVATQAEAAVPSVADLGLTPRQKDLCDLVVLGFTNREIAQALGVSVNTVRNTLVTVFQRAHVSTRAELVGVLCRAPPVQPH